MVVMMPSVVMAQDISVYLKGENMVDNQKGTPIIQEDRTFLPLRVIAEDLGFKVDWIQKTREIYISNDKDKLLMKLDSKRYSLNKESKAMDVAPFIKEDRTYVPVRFVAEALGSKAEWDGENRLVLIGDYSSGQENVEGSRFELKGLGLTLFLPNGFKDKLVFVEDNTRGYSIYDKANYEASNKEIGWIGSFKVEKNPGENPVPHIILGKVDKNYLTFSFASDLQSDNNKPNLTKSYEESKVGVRQVLKTLVFNK